MNDLIYIGLTAAFFALTAWLAAFAERLMPVPVRERSDEAREEAR